MYTLSFNHKEPGDKKGNYLMNIDAVYQSRVDDLKCNIVLEPHVKIWIISACGILKGYINRSQI